MLDSVSLLAAETRRSRAYLTAMRDNGLLPRWMVFLDDGREADGKSLADVAQDLGIDVVIVKSSDINAPCVVEAVAGIESPYVVFSGPAGAIVRRALFETGKRFIHVHPGRLPEFRGSTTIYYSLLAENKVEATALLLGAGIDSGPVIGRAEFDPPADRREIDGDYDAVIRSRLLVSVLRDFERSNRFEPLDQAADTGETFYIIHPVLKHLAILAS